MNIIKRMRKSVLAVLSVAGLVLTATADPQVIEVPAGSSAAEIAAAVTAAQPGDTVQLAAGTYVLNKAVSIAKGITVRGAGRFFTHIFSDGTSHRFFSLSHADAVLSDVTLHDAYLYDSYGSAVFISGGGGTVQDVIVQGGRAKGGGLIGIVSLTGSAAMRRCIVTGCRSEGILLGSPNILLENVLSYGNVYSGGNCGGLAVSGSGVKLVNCTFADNRATTSGNDDFYNNVNPRANAVLVNVYRGVTADTASTRTTSPSSTEVSAPGFVLPRLGNYHLTADSPLLGAGTMTDDVPDVDVDGNPMPATPSVGACQPSSVFVPDRPSAFLDETIDVTVNFPDGATGSGILTVVASDGTFTTHTVADGGTVQVTPEVAGVYSCVLDVPAGGETIHREMYGVFFAGAHDTYVDPLCETPQAPYTTEATAANKIEEAVAATGEGGTVWICDCDYTVAGQDYIFLTINRNVTIRGLNGPANAIIRQNTAYSMLYLNNPSVKLMDLGFVGSGTSVGSPAVTVSPGGGSIEGCVFENFVGTGYDGGNIIDVTGPCTLERCIIRNNRSNSDLVRCKTAGVVFNVCNCLICDNSLITSSAIWAPLRLSNGSGTVYNCTIFNNEGANNGELYHTAGDFDVRNCIFRSASMAAGTDGGHNLYGTKASPLTDPGFEAPDIGDYRLTKDAVTVIDQGDDTVVDADETDLAGVERKLGDHVDIGCYEWDPDAPVAEFVPDSETAFIGDELGVTVKFPKGATGTGTLTVLAPDGTSASYTVENGDKVTIAVGKIGAYSFALDVMLGGKAAHFETYGVFSAGARNTYFNPLCATPQAPYTTEATAATTLEEAIAATGVGGTVWVCDCDYEVAAKGISIDKGVTIRGLNGPGSAIFRQRAAATLSLFQLDNPSARIVNLGLVGCGGKINVNGQAVTVKSGGGSIEGCICENFAGNSYGYGSVIDVTGPCTLERCIIRNNNPNSNLVRCTENVQFNVCNCLICDNVLQTQSGTWAPLRLSTGSGTVHNCTIFNNTGAGYGEFYHTAGEFDVRNCIFRSASMLEDADGGCNLCGTVKAPIADPGFVDAANGDYRLTASATMAVDQGDDSVVADGEKDLAGEDRISGEHVDIGCYEKDANAFSAGFAIEGTAAAVGDAVTLVPVITGAQNPHNSWRVVNLCGGEDIVGETTGGDATGAFEVTFTAPGVYSFCQIVSAGENGATNWIEGTVTVMSDAAEAYVAVPGASVPAAPFDTPATAATNLWAMVKISPANATVHVLPGTHFVSHRIVVDNGRKILGAGRDTCVLTAGRNAPCGLLSIGHVSSVVSGLTLTGESNADATEGDLLGRCVYLTSGTFSDCRISNYVLHTKQTVWGGILQVSGSGGSKSISHVEIRNCTNESYAIMHLQFGMKFDNMLIADCAANGSNYYVLYSAGGAQVFSNCTFTCASGKGSCAFGSSTTAVNCILGGTISSSQGALTRCFHHCNFMSNIMDEDHYEECGNFNYSLDEIGFVDAKRGDYRLKATSPLAQAGLYDPTMRQMTDLAGRKRAKAGTVAVGCYQPVPNGLCVIIR